MVTLWSVNFVIGKVALREFPPLLLSGLRTTLAGLFILPIYFWSTRRPTFAKQGWTRKEFPALLTLGLCGVALNQVCFVLGLSRTSVAHSSITIALTPILVLTIAALAGQERFTAPRVLGMAVAVAGVATLNAAPARSAGSSLAGDAFIFLSSLTFALFTVAGRGLAIRHGSITVNTIAYVGGACALAPVTLSLGSRFAFGLVSAGAWMCLFYMALFPSMVCYLIYQYALSHIPASRVSAFSYLQPFLATLIALPVLGESITGTLAAGGALVLTGVFLTERA